MPELIYLDSCVLNRPADDQTQQRIYEETQAIAQVFDLIREGRVVWIASNVLHLELSGNPDLSKRGDSLRLLALASRFVLPDRQAVAHARRLHEAGCGAGDSLHLAIAHRYGVSTLLTVDNRFIRRTAGQGVTATTIVQNPVDWIRRRQPWLLEP